MIFLKSQVSNNNVEVRTDRNILEEVLELTRLNSKSIPRKNEISRESIHTLMPLIQEMLYMVSKNSEKDFVMLYDKLRTPIKRLCMELDIPKLYDTFIDRNEKYFNAKEITKNEKLQRLIDIDEYEGNPNYIEKRKD